MPEPMPELTLRPAVAFPSETLAAAFNAAYQGYFLPIQVTPAGFETHVATNDIALDRSLVAQAPDGSPQGIALLGVRGDRGWVGGVGVAPSWRGKGWGAALMRGLIEQAHEAGLRALQLEVLEQNAVAEHLYTRLGFAPTRRLEIFAGSARDVPTPPVPSDISAAMIAALPFADALAAYSDLLAAMPPWQREAATLAHLAHSGMPLQSVALTGAAGPAAVLLYAARDANVTLFGLASRGAASADRRDHGLALLGQLLAGQPEATLRAANLAPDEPLAGVLRALGCPVTMAQQEMLIELR